MIATLGIASAFARRLESRKLLLSPAYCLVEVVVKVLFVVVKVVLVVVLMLVVAAAKDQHF